MKKPRFLFSKYTQLKQVSIPNFDEERCVYTTNCTFSLDEDIACLSITDSVTYSYKETTVLYAMRKYFFVFAFLLNLMIEQGIPVTQYMPTFFPILYPLTKMHVLNSLI